MPWESYSATIVLKERLQVLEKALRLCDELEHEGLIEGFNVSLYSEGPHISIRVDVDITHKEQVKNRLHATFPNIACNSSYDEEHKIIQMYEAGSRFALDYYELVRKKRVTHDDQVDVSLFWIALHGFLNDIGLDAREEFAIHLFALDDRGSVLGLPWSRIAGEAKTKAYGSGVIRTKIDDPKNERT